MSKSVLNKKDYENLNSYLLCPHCDKVYHIKPTSKNEVISSCSYVVVCSVCNNRFIVSQKILITTTYEYEDTDGNKLDII